MIADDPGAAKRVEFIRREFISPLGPRFQDYLEEISVERGLRIRAAETERPDILDPKGWTPYPAEEVTVPLWDESVKGPTGGKTLHIRLNRDKMYLSQYLVKEPHALRPNTTYRLSGFIKLKDVKPQNKSGGVYYELNNSAKNWAESNTGSRRFSGTIDWVCHEMTFRTSDRIDPRALVCLRILCASGDAWFDGLRLVEIEGQDR